MKLRLLIILLIIVLLFSACGEKETPTDAIRLHVIANSDDESDQRVKLEVRDAIIKDCSSMFEDSNSPDESFQIVKDNSNKFEDIANKTLEKNGYTYGAHIETGKFQFPDKLYETTAYPAGKYRALKVVLGSGKGKNWWCVLYPPLCLVTKERQDDEETQTDESEEIIFESFILEKIFGEKTPQPKDEAVARLEQLLERSN
jgi:stage II sporulation protein R